jgi:hypothetical protein
MTLAFWASFFGCQRLGIFGVVVIEAVVVVVFELCLELELEL